jgi:hypothetical protein
MEPRSFSDKPQESKYVEGVNSVNEMGSGDSEIQIRGDGMQGK